MLQRAEREGYAIARVEVRYELCVRFDAGFDPKPVGFGFQLSALVFLFQAVGFRGLVLRC